MISRAKRMATWQEADCRHETQRESQAKRHMVGEQQILLREEQLIVRVPYRCITLYLFKAFHAQ